MSRDHADRERALAVVERERAEFERRLAQRGDRYEPVHAQAAFLHDRVAGLHDQVAALYDRLSTWSPDADMGRAMKQKDAQRRFLVALWPELERHDEVGQSGDSREGRALLTVVDR